MNNLLDQNTVAKFVARVEQLTPQTQGLWGKMDVAQMLRHCNIAVRMILTDKNIKPTY
jgi:hypothetical protein